MRKEILLFAAIREAAEAASVDVELDTGATASDLIAALAERWPQAGPIVRASRLAVDGRYVSESHVLTDEDVEIALIPPVSGG